MHPSSRHNLISDIFGNGLPPDLAALLGVDERTWLFLNLPAEFLPPPRSPDLPATVDVLGGRLVAQPDADLDKIERRARWHFPRRDQEDVRQRLSTDLALADGLLGPSVEGLFAVQLFTPCTSPDPDALATMLLAAGFPQVALLGGDDAPDCGGVADATIVKSSVDEVEERLRLVEEGRPVPARRAKSNEPDKRLRDRLNRLMSGIHLPRKLPVVIDMSPMGR